MSKILNEFIKRIDGPLFSISFLLIILGLITLAGSNLETSKIIVNQVFNISVGLIIFTLVIFTNPRILFGYAPILFFLTIFLLVLVHFFGIESNGAKRWLAFGGLNLQPSELIKITLPLMIAWLYQNFQNKISLKSAFNRHFFNSCTCVSRFTSTRFGHIYHDCLIRLSHYFFSRYLMAPHFVFISDHHFEFSNHMDEPSYLSKK